MSFNFNSFQSFGPIRVRAPLTLDDDSFSSSSEIEFSYAKTSRIRTGITLAIPSDCDTVEESEVSEAESDSRFFCRDDGRVSASLISPFLEFEKREMKENSLLFRPIAQLSMDDDTFEWLMSEEEVDQEFDYRLLSMTPPRVKILESDEDEGAEHESLGHGNSSIADWDSLSDKEIDSVEFVRDSISTPRKFPKRVVAENELHDEIQEQSIESRTVSDIEESKLRIDSIDIGEEETIDSITDFDIDEQLEEPIVDLVDPNRDKIPKGSEEQIDDPTDAIRTKIEDRDDSNPCVVVGEARVESMRSWDGRNDWGIFGLVNGKNFSLSDASGFVSVDAAMRVIMMYVDIIDAIARDSDDQSLMKLLAHFFSLSRVPFEMGACERRFAIQREIMGTSGEGTWECRDGENWRTEKLRSCYVLNDGCEGALVNGCLEDGCGKGVRMGKKDGVTWQTFVAVGLGSGTVIRVGMSQTCRGVIGITTTNSWLHLSLVTLAPFISSVCKNVLSL